MSIENDIRQVEVTLAEAKKQVRLADHLKRLENNRDFKAVILSEYLEQHAIDMVHAKAHPGMQSDQDQKEIIQAIDGIGCLRAFFSVIYQKAQQAENAIKANELTLEELNEENGHV